VTFDPFDVVVLPFPFADRNETVLRPAVILTGHSRFGQHSGVALVAMITSAKRSAWPLDMPITNLASAGLRVPCVVRAKLNSVDYRLIERKSGTLAPSDRAALGAALRELLGEVLGLNEAESR
jgi:mRNA interferase MazF